MWPNPHTELVTFTEEILNGQLQFLCSDISTIIGIIIESSFSDSYIYTVGADMETDRFVYYHASYNWKKDIETAFININHEFLTDGYVQAFEAYITRTGCIQFLVFILYFLRKIRQKQSSGSVLQDRCSYQFQKIHRKYMCQSLFFNKVAGWGL